jgi:alcohol dehydrogenase (cytochrome c)
MKITSLRIVAAVVLLCLAGLGAYLLISGAYVQLGAMAVNVVRYIGAPAGTISTERAADYAAPPAAPGPAAPAATSADWPSYNNTLTSQRFSPLAQITPANAGRLKVLCTYDTGQFTGFNAGLIEVDGALIGATEYDIFSIDPSTCRQNWRTHEPLKAATVQAVNRGAAYMDGRLFRGDKNGRVLAYDFKTGKRLWATSVADPKKGETTPAAPIAWNGLVFIGNAGGDIKGVKGRMYALDANTGRIVWEFYLAPRGPGDPMRGPQGASPLDASTWGNKGAGAPITGGATWTSYTLDPDKGLLYVPGGNPAPDFSAGVRPGENLYTGSVVVLDARTGAYKTHFKLVPRDWHDWDVSSAPALIHTRAGRDLMAVAPKDGHLYGFDLASQALLYRLPVTRVENADATFTPGKPVHYCPGSIGGAEWNGPAYDPQSNTIFVGEVEWCTTAKAQTDEQAEAVKPGQPWSGMDDPNPYNTWGKQDPFAHWAGWLYAVDADSGAWKWRVRSNYPVQSGVTPTAGGVVFFGDMGGNFYAVAADDGRKLWGANLGGAIGGGVITYTDKGAQRVAVAKGLTEILWPTRVVTAKVTVLGLASP